MRSVFVVALFVTAVLMYQKVLYKPIDQDARASSIHRANNAHQPSGCQILRQHPLVPVTASAAMYPLRTAPSIVEGQPVRVQSPASTSPGTSVFCNGRNRSSPGTTLNVAFASFITRRFRNTARFAAGKNSPNSRSAFWNTCSAPIRNCACDAEIVSST